MVDAATIGAALRLIRDSQEAALATSLDSHPYVSLVAVASDHGGAPLLLLSDLAQHTRNLLADPRLSLLLADAPGNGDPLARARLTLLGQARRCDDPDARASFTARHRSSAQYAGFADFHLYRVFVERGHLIAGFGRINWIDGSELGFRAESGGQG